MEKFFDPNYKHAALVQNVSNLLLRLPSLVFFCFFGVFLIFLADRSIPAELYDPFVVTKHVYSGGPIVIGFHVNRYKVCDVQYTNVMYDSTDTRFALPPLDTLHSHRPVGMSEKFTLGFDVPQGMASGPAVYQSERRYTCNFTQIWLAPITVIDPEIHFNIEEPKANE